MCSTHFDHVKSWLGVQHEIISQEINANGLTPSQLLKYRGLRDCKEILRERKAKIIEKKKRRKAAKRELRASLFSKTVAVNEHPVQEYDGANREGEKTGVSSKGDGLDINSLYAELPVANVVWPVAEFNFTDCSQRVILCEERAEAFRKRAKQLFDVIAARTGARTALARREASVQISKKLFPVWGFPKGRGSQQFFVLPLSIMRIGSCSDQESCKKVKKDAALTPNINFCYVGVGSQFEVLYKGNLRELIESFCDLKESDMNLEKEGQLILKELIVLVPVGAKLEVKKITPIFESSKQTKKEKIKA